MTIKIRGRQRYGDIEISKFSLNTLQVSLTVSSGPKSWSCLSYRPLNMKSGVLSVGVLNGQTFDEIVSLLINLQLSVNSSGGAFWLRFFINESIFDVHKCNTSIEVVACWLVADHLIFEPRVFWVIKLVNQVVLCVSYSLCN